MAAENVLECEIDTSGTRLGESGVRARGRGSAAPHEGDSVSNYTAKEVGAMGEEMAASHLVAAGYEILARNWRCRAGEIDIIARDGDRSEVVLIEVKTRAVQGGDATLAPELSVDRHKQDRYQRMALLYLSAHPELVSVRFDVIAINLLGYQRGRLRHLIGAYSWDEN